MGWKAASLSHLVRRSGGGEPAKPPTSAPAMEKPLRPRLRSCGVVMRRWFQVELLSPVQVDGVALAAGVAGAGEDEGAVVGASLRRPS